MLKVFREFGTKLFEIKDAEINAPLIKWRGN